MEIPKTLLYFLISYPNDKIMTNNFITISGINKELIYSADLIPINLKKKPWKKIKNSIIL
jgi:hypothetical protein